MRGKRSLRESEQYPCATKAFRLHCFIARLKAVKSPTITSIKIPSRYQLHDRCKVESGAKVCLFVFENSSLSVFIVKKCLK